jgi:hypothetical protein
MVAVEDAVAGMEVSQSQMVAAETALKLRQTRQNVPNACHAGPKQCHAKIFSKMTEPAKMLCQPGIEPGS